MKKFILLCTLLCMLILLTMNCFAAGTSEMPNVKVVIEGKQCSFDNVPVMLNNRTLLPMVAVLTNLGVQNDKQHIIWNGKESSITINKGPKKIYLRINNVTAYVNNVAVKIDAAPVTYKGRTYVPASFVAQTLGKKVLWDKNTSTVLIYEESMFNAVKDAFQKCSTSAANTRFKNEEKMEMDIGNGSKMVSDITTEIDVAKQIRHTHAKRINVSGDNVNDEVDGYSIKNVSYQKNMMTGKVETINFTKEQMKSEYDPAGNPSLTDFAGLMLNNNTITNEIILEGDICHSVYAEIFKNSILGMKGSNFKAHMRVVLDSKTYYCKELSTSFEGILNIGGTDRKVMFIDNNLLSDYNGDFEIVVPNEYK